MARRIRDLQRASYAVEAELIGFDQMSPLVEEVEDITNLTLTILGSIDGTELQSLLGYSRAGGVIDIDRLAVHPSCFRRRIGRSMMDALHLREGDASRFEVSTGAENRPAINLYRRLGYERVAVETAQGVRLVHLTRSAS